MSDRESWKSERAGAGVTGGHDATGLCDGARLKYLITFKILRLLLPCRREGKRVTSSGKKAVPCCSP